MELYFAVQVHVLVFVLRCALLCCVCSWVRLWGYPRPSTLNPDKRRDFQPLAQPTPLPGSPGSKCLNMRAGMIIAGKIIVSPTLCQSLPFEPCTGIILHSCSINIFVTSPLCLEPKSLSNQPLKVMLGVACFNHGTYTMECCVGCICVVCF